MGWGIQSMRMCRRWGRGGGGGCKETPSRARSAFDYILWLSVFAQSVTDCMLYCSGRHDLQKGLCKQGRPPPSTDTLTQTER